MKLIRFAPDMLKKIKCGWKTMTYRKTLRKEGVYKVEEGGHPYWKHIDTGIRIKIVRAISVSDIELYAKQFYRKEGFGSPQAFLNYIIKLYGKLPSHGWGHKFEVLKNG